MTGTLEHFNTPDHPSSEPKKNSLAQQVLLGIGDDLLFIQKAVFVAVVALEFGIDALHHLLRLQVGTVPNVEGRPSHGTTAPPSSCPPFCGSWSTSPRWHPAIAGSCCCLKLLNFRATNILHICVCVHVYAHAQRERERARQRPKNRKTEKPKNRDRDGDGDGDRDRDRDRGREERERGREGETETETERERGGER